MGFAVTPSWIGTFETNLQTLVVDAWKRRQSQMMWDKVMDVRKSATRRELLFWLIESAKISPEGLGGNKRYDDLAAMFQEIDNVRSGAGLILTKDEIEDNMMAGANVKGMPALDYAANWAKQMGGHAAYWPQDKLFNDLIAFGKVTTGPAGACYDGLSMFNAAHPVNPLGGGPTFANILTALPLSTAADLAHAAANLNAAVAAMRGFKMPNGKYRGMRARAVLFDPSNDYTVSQLLDAKFFNATDNVFTRLGIEPICCDELAAEPGVWYVVADIIPGEGGPFIFQDRLPYALTSYAPESQVELQRRKKFEWDFSGRNAVAFGHPFQIIRCEPS